VRARAALVAAAAVALVGASACSSSGQAPVAPRTASAPASSVAASTRPASTGPASTGPASTAPSGSRPVRHPFGGYGEGALVVTKVDGSVLTWCVLLALTQAEHERGLMDVTDLGGYDGMLFRFDGPQRLAFYMFHTKIALSIAFFAASGALVSSTDMEPCTEPDGNNCPLYQADGPYTDALEVVKGDLPRLGIGPGATVRAGGACPAA
jgi:uncharacterized protein